MANPSEYTGGTVEADHLCVLVHGLWGNPNHMRNVAKALRAKHPADRVNILCAKRNSGSFTYDGIELGGERLCLEIEEELRAIEQRGGKIAKLSVVGYSLGGLVARYAIGLLYAKGVLDGLECKNFTAFASPFVGVRTPLLGWANNVWNVMGARTLSMSGRQLFCIDSFRDTGRPLLSVLADTNSIFIKGLAKFQRRTLYSNIQNDRSTVYYTTCITKTDPYTDLTKVRLNYVQGYQDVILDPVYPVEHIPPHGWKKDSFSEKLNKNLHRVPFAVALAVFVPIGIVAFLINSAIQTVRSSKRIALHEKGQAGIDISGYRVPVLLNEIRGAVEDAYEGLNSSQHQEYLGSSCDDESDSSDPEAETSATTPLISVASPSACVDNARARRASERNILRHERKQSQPGQPTLALAPHQFEMITALDSVGWRKYPVHIHNNRHSHAAIIVRIDKESHSEGYIVLKHWLNEEFLV
ncbi:lipid particle protein [Diaporthe helianthi]|uniref:Lipid particle protein n=1 Tax=Diaporthe helianthi TaxID=158607 RepID=A0A2P5HL00_DIAHE|nr:lipid particle protein [Diaporthe helianthi]